tara:strand:- start:4743 stop:5567 length:825 start_codon:yes stop_codon:yes gene_type:complete
MEIKLTGADFSNTGLGNNRWVEKYIELAGITNPTKLAALRTLYDEYKAYGFDSKFEVFRLVDSGSASVDIFNTIDLESDLLVNFQNDIPAAHTTSGYLGLKNATTGRFGISEYKISSLDLFHMHTSLTVRDTSEATNAIGNAGLSGKLAGNKFGFNYRAGVGATEIWYEVGPAGNVVISKIPTDGAGKLASLRSEGRNIEGYYAGASVFSRTATVDFAALTGNDRVYEGNIDSDPSLATNSKFLFFAYGATSWSDTDEANLYTMITNYRNALAI